MEYIPVKTILSRVKYGSSWFGIDYNMNLYRGCNHGCIYCDSRSDCYHIENFDKIRAKENEIEILNSALAGKKEKGVVAIGSMSDTYNPLEKKYEITSKALELLKRYNFGIAIATKSNLIERDIPILKEINKHNDVIVKITITTSDDNLAKKLEPNVCTSSERFKTVKKLTNNGIFAGILLMPILPFINDTEENIIQIVEKAHQAGAKFIYSYMGVTLRDKQRDYYYNKIDKLYPELSLKYKKTYGSRYSCDSPNYKRLYKVFKQACEKYGILYKMDDIIKAYKKPKNQQISLF